MDAVSFDISHGPPSALLATARERIADRLIIEHDNRLDSGNAIQRRGDRIERQAQRLPFMESLARVHGDYERFGEPAAAEQQHLDKGQHDSGNDPRLAAERSQFDPGNDQKYIGRDEKRAAPEHDDHDERHRDVALGTAKGQVGDFANRDRFDHVDNKQDRRDAGRDEKPCRRGIRTAARFRFVIAAKSNVIESLVTATRRRHVV